MPAPVKSGAPECGLYVRVEDVFDFGALLPKLRELFFITTRSAYEKNMHVLECPGLPVHEDHVRGLLALARQNGFVAILRGDAVVAREWGADGVMLSQPDDIVTARETLGEDGIIGLRCGIDRNLADRGLELGIDYAVLAASSLDLISWWATKTDKPGVAEGNITNNDCGALVRAGATFIDSGDFILNHPQGVKQGAVDMLYAIDLALEKRIVN